MRKDINFKFTVNGVELNAPRNWKELEFLATYDNDSVQPNISTNELILVNEAYEYVMDQFNSGKVFEGLPCQISYSNVDVQNLNVFNGYIDLSNQFKFDLSKPELSVTIVKDNGLNSLNDRLSSLDYQFLENKRVFTQADYITINYVVEKPFNFVEICISVITIYLLSSQVEQSIYDISETTNTAIGIASSGIAGSVGSAIFTALMLILQITFFIILLNLILTLARDLFDYLVPPKRETKVIQTRKLLEKVANYLGYDFETGITDLDNYYFLPSNSNFDETDPITGAFKKLKGTSKGIPSIRDNGYSCLDMFDILKRLFNAKYQVIEGTLQFRTEEDPYWLSTSEFIKENPLKEITGINADELISNRLLSYQTDISDDYTIDNFKGTSFQSHTKLKTKNEANQDLIKGLQETNIPFALGNRKDKLNGLENTLKDLFKVVDDVANFFGGNSNLSGKIKDKVGLLKISTNNWNVPKLLYLQGNKLPTNHRDKISMNYIYNTYYYSKSFVLNNYNGQEYKIEGERIPLDLKGFNQLLNNGYFKDVNGDNLKAKEIVYNPYKNVANINYNWKEVYTTNLKEEYYEPE